MQLYIPPNEKYISLRERLLIEKIEYKKLSKDQWGLVLHSINKMAKIKGLLAKNTYSMGKFSSSSNYKNEKEFLYILKDKFLTELINQKMVHPEGYHIFENGVKRYYFTLGEYGFHLIDPPIKKEINLGRIEGEIAKTSGKMLDYKSTIKALWPAIEEDVYCSLSRSWKTVEDKLLEINRLSEQLQKKFKVNVVNSIYFTKQDQKKQLENIVNIFLKKDMKYYFPFSDWTPSKLNINAIMSYSSQECSPEIFNIPFDNLDIINNLNTKLTRLQKFLDFPSILDMPTKTLSLLSQYVQEDLSDILQTKQWEDFVNKGQAEQAYNRVAKKIKNKYGLTPILLGKNLYIKELNKEFSPKFTNFRAFEYVLDEIPKLINS